MEVMETTTLSRPASPRRRAFPSNMNITREDIDRLIQEPSVSVRMAIADKIGNGYNSGLFTEGENKLANEIFRLLLKDAQVKIRQLMAGHLKHSMQVPHDIVFALANDVSDVAVPILEFSNVLTEDDLILIVRATREHPKLKAVARRESISRELSHAIVEKHEAEVTKTLLSNPGASIAETSLEVVLEEFERDQSILQELVLRGGLPYAFAEKLFARVSGDLKKDLSSKYGLRRQVVEEATTSARETAVLQFISPWMSQHDINQLVEEMQRNKRLTDSVIIRSLCIGDLRFFETAIAKRVGIPPSNARILIMDPGPLGFKALYASCGLPESFYEAVQIMLRLAYEETEYGSYRTTDFCARMVGRIIGGDYHKTVENMNTLLTMIGSAIYDDPTVH
jgi:uncharacterized protein (DUF2336 family)